MLYMHIYVYIYLSIRAVNGCSMLGEWLAYQIFYWAWASRSLSSSPHVGRPTEHCDLPLTMVGFHGHNRHNHRSFMGLQSSGSHVPFKYIVQLVSYSSKMWNLESEHGESVTCLKARGQKASRLPYSFIIFLACDGLVHFEANEAQ